MFNLYANARPHETTVTEYLDSIGYSAADWRDIALSLMGYMSDDDVKDWAESENIFDFEED